MGGLGPRPGRKSTNQTPRQKAVLGEAQSSSRAESPRRREARPGGAVVSSLPALAPAAEEPKQKQSQSSAARVQQNVPDRALAGGNEGLVKFIRRRVERDQEQGEARLRAFPRARILSD